MERWRESGEVNDLFVYNVFSFFLFLEIQYHGTYALSYILFECELQVEVS